MLAAQLSPARMEKRRKEKNSRPLLSSNSVLLDLRRLRFLVSSFEFSFDLSFFLSSAPGPERKGGCDGGIMKCGSLARKMKKWMQVAGL